MSPFDTSAIQMLPELGRVVLSWLEHDDLCELLRKRAQVVDLRAQLALPRHAADENSSRWLSGTHVLCELASRERFGARACFIALPVDQAACLLDRVLGGSGQPGVAAAAGALSDAECGVLAHLAAQACAACGGALAVRDVFCGDAEKLRGLCADGALWPLRVAASPMRETPRADAAPAGGDLAFDVKLLFGAAADCPAGRYAVALALHDAVAREALEALEPGDLLTSDTWPLTFTARGLEGSVALGVRGISERAAVALCGARVLGGRAQVPRETPARAADLHHPAGGAVLAELRLCELGLGFWELAELAGGGSVELPERNPREATLYVEGQPYAAGPLVRLHGAVALRIHTLFSATRSDSATSSACPRASDRH